MLGCHMATDAHKLQGNFERPFTELRFRTIGGNVLKHGWERCLTLPGLGFKSRPHAMCMDHGKILRIIRDIIPATEYEVVHGYIDLTLFDCKLFNTS